VSDLALQRFGSRDNRQVGRELARLDAQARLSLAGIERTADVQAGRVQSLAYVGKQAMHAVVMVSEVEQQLCRLVPEAAGRLSAIGDITALGLAEIVTDTARQVSR
jgi:hypothetical protein